jgi:hypothetical protein
MADPLTLLGIGMLTVGGLPFLYNIFSACTRLLGFSRSVNLLDKSLELRAAFGKASQPDQVARMNSVITALLELEE